MAEGDRLSELATKDAGRAQALFREANTHYEKAFACGFPDAGIRFSFGRYTTTEDIDRATSVVLEALRAAQTG